MSRNSVARAEGADSLIELFSLCKKSILKKGADPYYSPNTVKQYAQKTLLLWRAIHGNRIYLPSDGWEWLLDVDNVLDKMNKTAYKSKKDYICPVVTLLRYLKNAELQGYENITDDIIKKYSDFITSDSTNYRTERRQNVAKPARLQQALSLDQARTLIDSFDVGTNLNREMFMKLLVQFYFEGELVPRNDLHLLKFILPPPEDPKHPYRLSNAWNYLVIDEKGRPNLIIMNNYKTCISYGQQTFSVPTKLADSVQAYYEEYGKEPNNFVFVTPHGTPFTKTNMSNAIRKATYTILGKEICIDVMRSINICHYYKNGPHSINEDIEKARHFLHSLQMQKEYYMLNFPDGKNARDDDSSSSQHSDDGGMKLVPPPPPPPITSDVMILEYVGDEQKCSAPPPSPNDKIRVTALRRPVVKGIRDLKGRGKPLICQIQIGNSDSESCSDERSYEDSDERSESECSDW